VKGLLDESYKIRAEYRDSTIKVLELARDYLNPQASAPKSSSAATRADADPASA
jgi:hypothetical protein